MSKRKPSAAVRDFWLYVIRRYDGAAVYCGSTVNPEKRWYDHLSTGVLANADPDDYQLVPVVHLQCTRHEAYLAEQRLSEALAAAGEPLVNINYGGTPVETKRLFTVVDMVHNGNPVLRVVTQAALDDQQSCRQLLRRVASRLPAMVDYHDVLLRVIASGLTRAQAEKTTEIDGVDVHVQWTTRGVPMYEDTRRAEQLARRGQRHAQRTSWYVLCVNTGDVFVTESDAAAWVGCSQPALHRALGKNDVAGGLHWRRLPREKITDKHVVHEHSAVRRWRGLPDEHVQSEVVANARRTRRPRPMTWIVNGETTSGDEVYRDTLPVGQTWLYEIRDIIAETVEVGVHRVLGQAWSVFVCSERFVCDHRYIVTANMVACKNRRTAIHLAQDHRRTLAAAGEHVRIYDHMKTDWHAAARKANVTKALKAGVVVRCVETGELFISASEAAHAHGLHTSAVYNVLNGHVQTAGGLHWQRVAISELTDEQLTDLGLWRQDT